MVLIHEACCHPLEADEVLRGSVYAGHLGASIAAPGVSIVDDPSLPGAVGSYAMDDDGLPAGPTTLVHHGKLTSFLSDRVTSLRIGLPATPNGRRDGYHNRPIPRMTNTCVLAGDTTPADIISDTEYGLYAPHVGGGEVLESTGDFVFRVANGYLIENGRITDPISETTVRGNGADVLRAINAVGSDVELGVAKCGKFGQLIPVGVCGPTVRIGSLQVGGTQS
jgi:TldD protein